VSPLFRMWACLVIITLAMLWHPPFLVNGESRRVLSIFNSETDLREELQLNRVRKIGIRFFHSYDWQWVTETFCVQDNYLVPLEVIYLSDSYDHRDHRYIARTEVGPHEVKLTVMTPSAEDKLNQIIYRVGHIKVQELILERDGRHEIYSFSRWGNPGEQLILSLN
jgi:hypothetical protein